MSRPRFLADNDVKDEIVSGLLRREPTLEFMRLRELDAADLPDPEVLQLATNWDLIVVSHDLSTMVGHAYARITNNQPFPGLIVAHQNAPVGQTIEDLLLIAFASEAEEWADRVTFLPL